jgi:hypothetical protein
MHALGWAVLIVLAAAPTRVVAQAAYEQDPINYLSAPVDDPVARLQKRIDAGEVKLTRDRKHGYLESLLKALNVPVSSQTLVFSKTSFQRDRISPATPRALYFNDDTYVGWVQGGEVIELATTDAHLGTVFYTLDEHGGKIHKQGDGPAAPRFVRQSASCLQCHGSTMTRDVPGLLVRSVFPDKDGQPVLSAGTFLTTQESPMSQRWGGWYVSGILDGQRHMGNVTVKDQDVANPQALLDAAAAAKPSDLAGRFDAAPYLTGHSDVVALLVLQHQAQVHNLLTRANYQTRIALRDEAAMDAALGRPGTEHSETTLSRIKDAGEPLVRAMLFCDEAPLGKVEGSSGFEAEFEARGPRDREGRSLRDLDLNRRVFKYPVSYLIYSEQFDALPEPVKDYVYRRLWDVLTGADDSAPFSHLTANRRRSALEIVLETKKGLPAYWKLPAR